MNIPALKVKQWLSPEWDNVQFEPKELRSKPEPHFYLFTLDAYTLKKLTGIYRRAENVSPNVDLGIQRKHMPERSLEILRYVRDGFPLSRIDKRRFVNLKEEVSELRMPGWLPTCVVVNILSKNDVRGQKRQSVRDSELVKIVNDAGGLVELQIPDKCRQRNWQPEVYPIEVIDGQHRLWAFEPSINPDLWTDELIRNLQNIEIPVVAFSGLSPTWQAYLFYTINQLSKKIDISMVFDLYPLLRTEDWLLKFEGPNIYRENRAQDLTMLLWSHPQSPWKDRIIRFGGREKGKVTQSSYIRSLMATFIKRWDSGNTNRTGGLFGSRQGQHDLVLNWGREQQAAFLIKVWELMRSNILESNSKWSKELIQFSKSEDKSLLFDGPYTLLASDQGVRGFLGVVNDFVWHAITQPFGLNEEISNWAWERPSDMSDEAAITNALTSINKNLSRTNSFINELCASLSHFDWRLSSALAETAPEYTRQASYRGSGGYREIKRELLSTISENAEGTLKQVCDIIINPLTDDSEDEQ